ncbi:hypothetical protein PV08_11879 [Exophiala spinifera]|uniref:Zn(2)-C6 fungal-type domain-containing protein n=1 Tax=Exophiala spinifera TaxID=91928 RepID=A0A0D2BEF1_9EURO|nr:uncharacterized protein PV08_11879 [Exophiala spinifera]KIW09779.1 hypothetical protein PV08_11879 [Exophiala spinifera]
MDSRGNRGQGRTNARLAIRHRSCDQCRSRKIGCDRASPCGNCTSAGLDCTHSTPTPKIIAPKQRVLISAQYEQKIDGIAGGIEDIKRLLRGKDFGTDIARSSDAQGDYRKQTEPPVPVPKIQPAFKPEGTTTSWETSSHIVDFVKAVVKDCDLRYSDPEIGQAVSSLSTLVESTDGRVLDQHSDCGLLARYRSPVSPLLPPLKAAHYALITNLSRILPLEKFSEICQKVYFAVDEYNDLEFILANGYLSYISFEYFVASGIQEYNEYCNLCWKNLVNAFARLPLILPQSMESIAVLALGAFNAIENSKSSLAWTFISYAANLCLTLGYHRKDPARENESYLRVSQESLFWLVYNLDKGLSLRLSRSSNIRDRDITLTVNPNALLRTRQSMIQGQVYDQLYSPSGLSKSDHERRTIVNALALELRELIQETRVDIMNAEQLDPNVNPMAIVYLRCDLVCSSSTLALILRAAPAPGESANRASEECVTVAREVMDIHQQCMDSVKSWKGNTAMLQKYINWAVLHTPFIPFSILFTQAVQQLDQSDLARIEHFASSLKPEATLPASPSHPYRIYELLSRTARLCVDNQIQHQHHSQSDSIPTKSASSLPTPTTLTFPATTEADFGLQDDGHGPGVDGLPGADELDLGEIDFHVDSLSEWYYGNQQIMNLMDDDAMAWTYQ